MAPPEVALPPGFELDPKPAGLPEGFALDAAPPPGFVLDGSPVSNRETHPAPDTLLDQASGVVRSFQRGTQSALRAVDVLGELTDKRVPTLRQGRRAFEQAMADPRYNAQLAEASRLELEDPAAGARRAAKAEELFGPPAKLEQLRRPIVTEQEARRFDIAQGGEKAAAIPQSQAMQRWAKADNSNWWQVFASDPVEIIANIAAESLPQSMAGMAAGAVLGSQVGPTGTAAGVGAGSFAVEYANSILQGAADAGFDMTKPEAVKAFFASPKALGEAKDHALKRGVPVAVLDAVSARLAGKFLGPAIGKGVRPVLAGVAKETAAQGVAGGTGEALAQMASGEKFSPKEIFAEVVGELASGPTEVATNIQAERARNRVTTGDGKVIQPEAVTTPPAGYELDAVPKTGTEQTPVTSTVTPPAEPKVDVTADLAAELQAALTGNQGKPHSEMADRRSEIGKESAPAVAPTPNSELRTPNVPLRFRAIVEEGKVPSELVIQPLTEELYDAVIHVEGLTPDFEQFQAENPEATHLSRMLMPTGKFAHGHKFGPLNELVPPGIGSRWEAVSEIGDRRSEIGREAAPSAATAPSPNFEPPSPPPPQAQLTPPAPAPTVGPAGPETISSGTALTGTQAEGKASTSLKPATEQARAVESGESPDRSPANPFPAGRQTLGKAASRVTNGKHQRSTTTEADGLLHDLATLGLKLPFFRPDPFTRKSYNNLLQKARRNEPLTQKEKDSLARFKSIFPHNYEDNYGPAGEIMEQAYKAAQRAGLATELFREQTGLVGGEWDTQLDALRQSTGKDYTLRQLFEAIPALADAHAERKGGVTDAKEAAHYEAQAKADANFRRDQSRPVNGTVLVPPDDVREGSSYTLNGTKLRVTDMETDEQGRVVSVTLDDGKKYMTQRLTAEDGSEVPALRMDEGSLKDGADTGAGENPFSRRESPFITPASNPKEFEKGYIHINLRGGEIDQSRPLTGWVLPADLDDFPNTMNTRYGAVGRTAVFVPKEWVTHSKTKPTKIKDGYIPRPEHVAVIPAQAIRPSGTVDWAQVFVVPPPASENPFSRRADVNRELNELKAKFQRTPTENARITALEDELGQQDLFPVETRDVAEIERELEDKRNKAELERRRAERLTASPIEVQGNIFGERLEDKTGQGAFFSRGEGSGVSIEAAQARADELTGKWFLPFGVEVVQSWQDLPARARRGITAADGHTVEGRYVPGSGVFLVADNLASPDRVAAVVLHEVLGHFGIDTVLREQRDAFMLDVFRSFQGKPLFQQKVRDYAGDFENGRTPVTPADKILLGRELVAALAENPAENPGIWQRIVDAVRRWLRDIGWVQDVTEADIREALRRADRELRGVRSVELGVRSPGLVNLGGGVLMTPGAQLVDVRPDALAALTAHHGTPHKVDKFSTEKIGTGEGAQVYGWGLYFAENEQVAEEYRKQLSGWVRVDGKPVTFDTSPRSVAQREVVSEMLGGWPAQKAIGRAKEILETRLNKAHKEVEAYRRAVGQFAEGWGNLTTTLDDVKLEEQKAGEIEAAIRELETFRPEQFTTDPGNRYTVTLNVEPEDLLDWDKPLSEQSEKVRKAFEQELTGLKWQRDEWPQSGFSIVNSQGKFVLSRPTEREARTDTLDGATLYKVVTQEETPQKATEKLLTRGVKGIRYLDQGSRRAVQLIPPSETVHGLWLVKEIPNGDVLYRGSDEAAAREAFRKFEQEKTYNYVIFNEDDIRITHENGQPVAAAAFSRTTQPTEPLADLLARRDEAAARGITYTAQREKLRADGKTIPDSLKKAEREQADIFKEASFQLLRHPDYVAQQVRAVDAKLDELNTLKERQRILKQQGTDLESDARARLAELEHWLPIETGEEAVPFQHADEFAGIPPSLVKQAIERTPGLKHFVTEADKKRMRAILDNPNLTQAQKDKALEDLERNRGRQLAEVPLPNALPPRANVALATSTTLAGNQDARGWWEAFARYARNLASATPEIPLFGPLARLNVPMRGFLNAIRAGNMTAARDAETMVRDVVQPLLDLPRAQLDPNALARHQAIAKKLQFAERQFDQQAERMRAEIAMMEQARGARAAITERREALAEFEGNPPAKIAELQKQLAEAVGKLQDNPMWLFKQAVLFRDYVSRFQMLAPKQQGRFKFPGNLSIQDVVNELARTEEAIEASPARDAIRTAMDRHYRAMAELEGELLKRGHLIPEAMKNGAYFPHQVLDYTSQHLGRLKPATEAPFRGYLIDPTGSRKAIETDYIQAIYRHAAEVMAHNAHQDAVEKFLKPLDRSESIRETVEAKAAAEGRTAGRFEWRSEDNLPPGHVFYDAARKLPLRLGYVLDPQTIADALFITLKDGDVIEQMQKLGLEFTLKPEMLQQALVAGEKQPWVIPKEVAEALDGILDRQRQEEASARAPFVRRLRQAVSLWKLNTLFAPWHYLRYEWGNTLSDVVDKLGGADLGMAKYLPQAFKEVIAFADKQGETKDIRAAFEQRVLDTVTFAEVEKVKDSPAFEQLRSDTQRALATAGNFAKGATFPAIPIIRLLSGANVRSTVELSRLREATFRYAKFLADLDRIRNGQNPVYAGAYWKDVEAEGTPEEKAALIARRTFGDYGDLSVSGEWLRKNLVPFYSWTEINFRYHANLLRNMADMIRQGEFGSAAQSAWAVAAWTALRLALPYAAVHLWNTVGGAMAGAWDDDDDLEATLSEADRRRFHLILGKDERGQTRVVYLPTAFSDVVSWFGGDNAARLLAEYARGDITFERVVGDFAKQIGPDTLNKVAQSTGPVGKGAFIAISGKQPFPDITNMRSVAGREKWFAVVQTMTDREGTDLLRRAFDNDYYPRPAGEVAKQLILQIRRRDPEQWAFYEVKEKVSDWKERKTGKRFEAGDYSAPEAQALRNFRRAVYLGDADAAERFYTKLLGYGYTSERLKASIRNQHPLAELNEEGRREFVRSLSRADREQLRRALQYWERLGTLKGKERGLFPAKAGQRFTPQPERLQRAVQDFDRKSDEEVRRQAERLVESALTGRR